MGTARSPPAWSSGESIPIIGQWRIERIVLTKTRTSCPSTVLATTRSSASVEGVSTGYASGVTFQVAMPADGAAIARTRAMSVRGESGGHGFSSGRGRHGPPVATRLGRCRIVATSSVVVQTAQG